MDKSLLKSCSPAVQKGIKRLDEDLDNRSRQEWTEWDAKDFYILDKVNSSKVKEFSKKARESPEEFRHRDFSFEKANLLTHLAELGHAEFEYFQKELNRIKSRQTIEGKIHQNTLDHVGPLRSLAFLEPEGPHTERAITYLQQNIDSLRRNDQRALALIALDDLDPSKHSKTCTRLAKNIIQAKDKYGSLGGYELGDKISYSIKSQALCIRAINRLDKYSKILENAVEKLKNDQNEKGGWGRHDKTANALEALIEIGEGPKISKAEMERKLRKEKARTKKAKPEFLKTSPDSAENRPVRRIDKKLQKMIEKAEEELLIAIPYIDMHYESIIDFYLNDKDREVKIVTKFSNNSGHRSKIEKGAKYTLKEKLDGQVKKNHLLHSRMLIADGEEMIIGSSDLTRDQLYDEFNAALHTKDKDAVNSATEFFQNIWEKSETLK